MQTLHKIREKNTEVISQKLIAVRQTYGLTDTGNYKHNTQPLLLQVSLVKMVENNPNMPGASFALTITNAIIFLYTGSFHSALLAIWFTAIG